MRDMLKYRNSIFRRIGVKIRLMYETVRYSNGGLFRSRGVWCHGDRIIDTYEVIFVERGTVYLNEAGVDYELEPQQMLLLEPGLRHFGTRPSSDVSFFWFHYWADNPPAVPKSLKVQQTYRVLLLMRQLLHFDNTAGYPQEARDYLMRLILMELNEQASQTAGASLAARTAEWIRSNSYRPIQTGEVAAQMQYNSDYLNRVFRQVYGISIKCAIDRARMEHIKTLLLNSDQSLQSIATVSGFTDYKYFLKYFRYHEGRTPSEFRNAFFRSHINVR